MAGQIIIWYGILFILGWINYPFAALLFPHLKHKGFAFAKILGLLMWGYLYWIANIFGLLSNSLIGAISALLIVIVINTVIFFRKQEEIKLNVKENIRTYLTIEVIFLITFVITSLLRAMSPNLTGTEKPMELAFINSILATPEFPPSDPWLSGYAISYYYFGYLMVALLARLSGVTGGVAFNLGISVWVGMICTASYGILYELLEAYFKQKRKRKKGKSLWLALLAPFFLLVVSNAEGGLEMLHASGTFWSTTADGNQQSTFWEWLDIQELNEPPAADSQWTPQRIGGTWWWRASRVVSDYDAAGNFREVIDEFPAFTFYLADLHPHVLSIPFLLLTIALALNLYLGGAKWLIVSRTWRELIKDWHFWSTTLILGAMLFMNTWDFPASFGLTILVFILLFFKEHKWGWNALKEIVWKIALLALGCMLVYIPFFLGFDSQAGGILPSLIYTTRGAQFTVMFFPFLLFLLLYLLGSNHKQMSPDKKILRYFLFFVTGISLFALLFPFSRQAAITIWNELQGTFGGFEAQLLNAFQQAQAFAATYNATDISSLMQETLQRRFTDPSVALVLLLFLYLIVRFLFRKRPAGGNDSAVSVSENQNIHDFVHLMIFMGAGLCLIPEFFFLVDVFSSRMNTIFKFYFQAWILWSIAGAFALIVIWDSLKGWKNIVFRAASILIIGISCAYPFFTYYQRIRNTDKTTWTLDGTAYFSRSYTGDAAAIDVLGTLPYGVVAEAVGGSYTNYARIATNSGYPAVLGWPGHEIQWRGGYEEMGSRQSDMQTLYETSEWFIAEEIIQQYGIAYIIVGNLERNSYVVDEGKFVANLTIYSQVDGTTLYGYP